MLNNQKLKEFFYSLFGQCTDCKLSIMTLPDKQIRHYLPEQLDQLIADSLDRTVVTGPIEGAAMGNLLTQAMALGDIENLDQLRQVVRNSETVNTWNPNHTPEWEVAYQKLLTFLK